MEREGLLEGAMELAAVEMEIVEMVGELEQEVGIPVWLDSVQQILLQLRQFGSGRVDMTKLEDFQSSETFSLLSSGVWRVLGSWPW